MIDTRRLRTLRAVADHGTVTAAAAALHLTPSAVSQQLAALEHEVGHRLLTRDGRGVRLTAVGRILLEHTNEVLAQLERAQAEVAAYASGQEGEITVASFATAISVVLAPAIRELRDKAPDITIKVRDAEGDQALTLLLDEEADIAIAVEYRGAPASGDPRLTRIPLYAEPFDLVLPHDHAPVTRLADLKDEPWIGPYPGNPVHDLLTVACEREGFTPAFTHYSDDFRAVVALIGAGAGVALVPRLALRHLDLSLVTVRAAPGPERRVFAAVRRGAEHHPLLTPLIEALATRTP
ncbi:LysR family transcriptional regulator [Nonomuraea sp. NPDC050663]|uniref:LysR family transcriptional regulator n=1 Tax=Nonomuraea sp. NPDC050663 TaxID=3364370 RepID=UPI0037B8086B